METIFTKIVNGELPSYKIAEDEKYYAFLEIAPLQEGHTLVIPKKEIDYIFDLEDNDLAGLVLFAKRVAKSIKEKLGCKRVAIIVLGTEVPHAHIHLIPMNKMGDADFTREKLKLTPEEFNQIAKTISI